MAVVLLPQSVAYAELAGVPASRGIATAAAAALLGTALGSSPVLQTGPTALASLLTFGVLAERAEPLSAEFVMLAAILAIMVGAVRLVLGVLRLGKLSALLSEPVVTGLASGAGILIVASQMTGLLGVDVEGANPLVQVARLIPRLGEIDLAVLAVGAVTVLAMGLIPRVRPRAPTALIALVLGGVVAALLPDEVPAVDLGEISIGIPNAGFAFGDVLGLAMPAIVIGLIGFSEASAIARRFATRDRSAWDPSRELIGQGAACAAAGIVGGFPVSGSFSRSALAHLGGVRSRVAGIVTGTVAILAIPLAAVLPAVPRPALAAVVAMAGVGLLDIPALRTLWRHTSLQFWVAGGTLGATLALAPRIDLAVVVGLLLAVAAHLFREEQLHVRSVVDGDVLRMAVHGVVFYASAPSLADALATAMAEHPDVRELELDLSGAGRVDVSGALLLAEVVDDVRDAGTRVAFTGVPPQATKILVRLMPDVPMQGLDPLYSRPAGRAEQD